MPQQIAIERAVRQAFNVSYLSTVSFTPMLQQRVDAILKNGAANVAIGERMAEFIAARGVAGDKIRVIPNWTDDEAIAPIAAAQNPLRAGLGLENAFIVGYSGNLGRVHEFETVLGAAELLRREKHLVFVVIGRGVLSKHCANVFMRKVSMIALGFYRFNCARISSILCRYPTCIGYRCVRTLRVSLFQANSMGSRPLAVL